MKIGVVGLWHLGCVTAACLAQLGFDVTGWDSDPDIVKKLSSGQAPLFEPGLDNLLAKGIQSKKLRFAVSAQEAIRESDFMWVTFDTPVDADDRADVAAVKRQIITLIKNLKPQAGIIISSQLPVGSCSELEAGNPVCYSPENLRLGKAIEIFQNPDRIVVGIRKPEDRTLFEPVFAKISPHIEWMNTESAEMTKHAINSFLALSVAFANELAVLCESVGADAHDVERGLKTESRIGPKAYLKPGAAFAGGTLARDVQFLTALGEKYHHPSLLLHAILKSNQQHKEWAQHKLQSHLKNLKGRRVAILGLAYKEGTDTLRRSWAIELSQWLHQQGAQVQAFDWQLEHLPKELASTLSLKSNYAAALDNCDAVVIGTDHPNLKQIQSNEIQRLKTPLIIDPNGSLNRTLIDSLSPVDYYSVGFAINKTSAQ